jgi:hypothetical protein
VPWVGLIAKSPAMEGRETLAIDMSRMFMNEPRPSAIVAKTKSIPVNGSSSGLFAVVDIFFCNDPIRLTELGYQL